MRRHRPWQRFNLSRGGRRGGIRLACRLHAAFPGRGCYKTRQDLALEYGATDIVAERGDAGVARIKELTVNVGADFVGVLAAKQMEAGRIIVMSRQPR
jgi:hypothetical protein